MNSIFDSARMDIYRYFAQESSNNAISAVFEKVGRNFGLREACWLKASKVPFIVEVANRWECDSDNSDTGTEGTLLDFTENSDWELFNPYIQNSQCIVSDTGKEKKGKVFDGYVKERGIGAFFCKALTYSNDFIGMVFFAYEEPHEWSHEEIEFLNDISDSIMSCVRRLKYNEVREFMMHQAEKAAQDSLSAKNQFISNVSHEIRTPINAITGMVSIMRHNIGNAEVINECLERMEKSSKQLMDLINDCVDMTVFNNEEVRILSEWCSVQSILDNVTKVISPVYEAKQQHLELIYDENLSINVDKNKLSRILMNILLKCSRTSGDGASVTLEISTDKASKVKNLVKFRIKDETVGLTESDVQNVFEPFRNDGFSAVTGSTGLGMMITKKLVDIFNGTIDFTTDGWGSEFVVTLSLETRGEMLAEEEDSEEEENNYAEMYIGRRILVAEDNILMSEILSTILGYKGLETDAAYDGKEAVELFESHDAFYYDMILMDIQMPQMSGIEATQKIRNSERADADMIPIIALSANALDDDIKKSLEAGMNAHLVKPVGEKELFATISEYVL